MIQIGDVWGAYRWYDLDEEVVEFNIAHNRKYSIDHLWYQEKDDEKIMVGISEFMGVEIGEVLRVILPQAETVVDEGQDMFSLWTADEKIAFTAPFSGTITEVNGEVEINPDLVNESAYDLGWILVLQPFQFDMENLLEPDEYVEYLSELWMKWNYVRFIAASKGITPRCTDYLERRLSLFYSSINPMVFRVWTLLF